MRNVRSRHDYRYLVDTDRSAARLLEKPAGGARAEQRAQGVQKFKAAELVFDTVSSELVASAGSPTGSRTRRSTAVKARRRRLAARRSRAPALTARTAAYAGKTRQALHGTTGARFVGLLPALWGADFAKPPRGPRREHREAQTKSPSRVRLVAFWWIVPYRRRKLQLRVCGTHMNRGSHRKALVPGARGGIHPIGDRQLPGSVLDPFLHDHLEVTVNPHGTETPASIQPATNLAHVTAILDGGGQVMIGRSSWSTGPPSPTTASRLWRCFVANPTSRPSNCYHSGQRRIRARAIDRRQQPAAPNQHGSPQSLGNKDGAFVFSVLL
jgi:hypothetical protein